MNLKRTLARRLERIVRAADPQAQASTERRADVHGAIDVLHEGSLFGWIGDASQAPVESIDCTIDGHHVGSAGAFHFRQDLADLGFGDGKLGFEVPIPATLADGTVRTIRIHAFAGGRKRGELVREMRLGGSGALNANPFLRLSRDRHPEGWEILPDRRRELRLSMEHGVGLPGALPGYLRLCTLVEPGVTVGLHQPLELEAGGADHTIVIVARSLTATSLHVRTAPMNGKGGAYEEVPLGGTWSVLRVPYRADGPGSEIRVELRGPGEAVVDIACIALTRGPGAEIPTPSAGMPVDRRDAAPGPRTYAPDTWNRGIRFSAPARGSELCAGWFFDCAGGQEATFEAKLVVDADREIYSLGVQHLAFEGFSRVATKCDRADLLRRTETTLTWSVTLRERPDRLLAMVVGRNGDRSATLWQKALVAPGEGRVDLEASLTASEMSAIRANASQFASLEIALESRQSYTLTIHELRCSSPAPRTAQLEPSTPQGAEGGFEDPIVAAQASRLIAARPAAVTATEPHRIDVVIPVFNAAEDVHRSLSALLDANDGAYRLIVLDDASGAQTARLLDGFASRDATNMRLLRHEANRGYTATINHGVEASSAAHVVILNSDTVVPRGWHQRLLRVFEEHPRTGIAGPLSNAASWQSLPHRFAAGGDWLVNDIPGGRGVDAFQRWLASSWAPRYPLVPLLNGFCMAYRREVFDQVGGFDEEAFPIGYGEENDICLRASAMGFELRVVDDLYVYHAKSKSFQGRRAALTKTATSALHAKHATTDWDGIVASLRHHPDLHAVRDHVIRAFFGA